MRVAIFGCYVTAEAKQRAGSATVRARQRMQRVRYKHIDSTAAEVLARTEEDAESKLVVKIAPQTTPALRSQCKSEDRADWQSAVYS